MMYIFQMYVPVSAAFMPPYGKWGGFTIPVQCKNMFTFEGARVSFGHVFPVESVAQQAEPFLSYLHVGLIRVRLY